MVKSVKQDQVITQDKEIFLKKIFSEMLKNMPGGGLGFNPGQYDEKIKAHMVVLVSLSTPSGICSRLMTRIHITN